MNKERNKIVFASDFHLGIDVNRTSKERELLIVEWLMSMKDELAELYLVGDIFDYWYEYKRAIPRGFSDFLSVLKILRNEGVKITIFTGNHDMWMFDYFTKEYGIKVCKEPILLSLNGFKIYVGHGDGLGPGDHFYKVIKALFSNRICQWLFSMIHPTIALQLMKKLSQRDAKKYIRPDGFSPENEWLIKFAEDYQEQHDKVDAFIFGHRHLVYDHPLEDNARVINLGDWISYFSYAMFDGETLSIEFYKEPEKQVYL